MKNFSFINFLPPWVETNIQPAFYDKESGSVLQQTARMYAKVNQLVRHFNCLAKETKETVDDYIAKFVELKDFVDTYFENLDVQEEINNKLDALVADGTIEGYVDTYLEDFMPSLEPNKYLDMNMGCTTFWRGVTRESMFEQIENIEKYFSKLKFQIRLTFDEDTQEFVLDDNFSDQVDAIAKYLQDGGTLGGLHFYQETKARFAEEISTYGANLIFGKYLDAVNYVLDTIPFKSSVGKIWLFNEAGHENLSTANKTPIIDCIEALQAQGFLISIPVAYAEDFRDIDQDILASLDFYSLNCYPTNDYYGQKSSIEDVAERFNTEFRIIEPYLAQKYFVVSEFGCSSSWTSFSNPASYQEDHIGKPISLMLEGFFQSDFINNITECYCWYYTDAYRYAPATLLSIKNNTEVRYNG